VSIKEFEGEALSSFLKVRIQTILPCIRGGTGGELGGEMGGHVFGAQAAFLNEKEGGEGLRVPK